MNVVLQVVPTIYSNLRNDTISTNQYSVTEHFKESNIPMQHNLPGVFFYYDLSPIKVSSKLASYTFIVGQALLIVNGHYSVSIFSLTVLKPELVAYMWMQRRQVSQSFDACTGGIQ